MKKHTILYIVWAVLYCACVGFSFVDPDNAGEKAFLVLLSVGFFVPPYILVFRAKKQENRKTVKILRWICIGVLALSLVLLTLNILSVKFSSQTGLLLYVMLAMFAPPLACARQWALSLFLWACLMMLTRQKQCPCQK